MARTANVVVVSQAAPTLRLSRPPSALLSTEDLCVSDRLATHALGSLTHAWRQGAAFAAGAPPQPEPAAAEGDEPPPSAAEPEVTPSPAEPPSAVSPGALPPPSPFPAPAAFRPVEVRPTASLHVDGAGRVPFRPSTQDVS